MGELRKRDEEILALHVATGPYCDICDTHSGYGEDEGAGNNPDCTHMWRNCASCKNEQYPCKTRQIIEPREVEERPVRIVARAIAREQWSQMHEDGDEWDEREHFKVSILVYMAMARAAMETHEALLKRQDTTDGGQDSSYNQQHYDRAVKANKNLLKSNKDLAEQVEDVRILLLKRGFSLTERGFPSTEARRFAPRPSVLVGQALDELQDRVKDEEAKAEQARQKVATISGLPNRFSLDYHLGSIEDAVRGISKAVEFGDNPNVKALARHVPQFIERAKEEKE